MEAHPTAPPIYPPRRWPWVVGGVAALAIAAFLIWFFAIRDTGSSTTLHGPSEAPFTLTLQPGWKSMSQQELSQQPGSPLAVLVQTNGAGVVIINTQPPSSATVSAVGKEVEDKLRHSVSDFKLIGAGPLNVAAGEGFQISYARTKVGTANTLVVVSAGGRIYTLNSVIPGGDQEAVKQAIAMIQSFNA